MVAAAAVIAAVVVPVAVLNHDDGGARPPAPVSTPSPSPSVITYPDPGVFVQNEADTAKLRGTTAAFKTFIAGLAVQANADGAACPMPRTVTVEKYGTDGYALGGVNDCGGYEAVWGVREGTGRRRSAARTSRTATRCGTSPSRSPSPDRAPTRAVGSAPPTSAG